jgi:CubicO group peptidase (beta-lactamase class C family)
MILPRIVRSELAVAFAVWVAACAPPAAQQPPQASAAAAPPVGSSPAPTPGSLEALAKQLDDYSRLAERGQGIAGMAVAVQSHGRSIISKGYGFADVLRAEPMSADHVFRIGSISKTFTAAAILKLEEQGRLRLDDAITEHVPEYAQARNVTLRHLLTHTGGVPSYTDLPWYAEHQAENTPAATLLATFTNQQLAFAPGSRFAYSNSGYYLLGLVIERVSGQRYADYLKQEIFDPAGLQATRYCPDEQNYSGAARGYDREQNVLEPSRPLSMSLPFSAGALCSTAPDLVRWLQALSHGKVISTDAFARMSAPTPVAEGEPSRYGFGLALEDLRGHAMLGHGGGIDGFVSAAYYYPADDAYVVVLFNTQGGSPASVARGLARLTIGIEVPEVLDLPLSAAEATPLVGTYEVAEIGQTVRVSFENGQLRLDPGRRRMRAQGDGKYAVPELEAVLSFEAEQGRVQRMIVEQRGKRFVGQRKD